MKFLKIPLADGEKYTIQTFTLLQKRVMAKEYEKFNDYQDEADRINFEVDDNNQLKKVDGKLVSKVVSTKDKERLKELEELALGLGLDVIRKCLSAKHPKFKKVLNEDGKLNKEEDDKVTELVMSLIDESDIQNIVNFAFHGTYVKQDNVIEIALPDFSGEDDGTDSK